MAIDPKFQSENDSDSLRAERGNADAGESNDVVGSADGPSLGAMARGPVADEARDGLGPREPASEESKKDQPTDA